MRKAFAIAFLCAGLGACQSTDWAKLSSDVGSLAGDAAVPLCANVAKTAGADTACLSKANAIITLGQALAAGLLR